MTKPTTKIKINDRVYEQIKKKAKNGEPGWWKLKPRLNEGERGSGLHMFDNPNIPHHWDYYDGKKELEEKKYTEESKLGGFFIDLNQKGEIFAIPPNMVLILGHGENIPKLITLEEYRKNRRAYVLADISKPIP